MRPSGITPDFHAAFKQTWYYPSTESLSARSMYRAVARIRPAISLSGSQLPS